MSLIDPVPSEKILDKPVSKAPVVWLFFQQLRPRQWTKNLLIFAAPIFSVSVIDETDVAKSVIAFFLFCFVSGAVYILNDFMDREADRLHPEKRHRPIASGVLNPYKALVFGAILVLASLGVAFKISVALFTVIFTYFLMNVGYSFYLKHVVIIDVMTIAAGFVLRAIAGGLAIDVPFTPWFLLCVMLLALFLAISKRRHELMRQKVCKQSTRKVLKNYSVDLLDQLNTIVTTATIMCYALFTFTSRHTVHLMWTVPFVIYGIFRYLYLIHIVGKGETPENVLLTDKHILFTVVFYAVAVVSILTWLE